MDVEIASPPTLESLPPEIVGIVLHDAFEIRPDGTLALPAAAAVSSAFRRTLKELPEISLHIDRSCRNVNKALAVERPRVALAPTALDIHQSCVDAQALVTCVRAADACGRPLRALALRKCHSLTARGLPGVLLAAQSLTSLVCSGVQLNGCAVRALGGLRGLRVLCLAECHVHADLLLATLPKLQGLRCLMLAGANLLRESAGGMHADGIFALNDTLVGAAAEGGGGVGAGDGGGGSGDGSSGGSSVEEGGSSGVPSPRRAALPRLALLDLTFVHASERAALEALAPTAHTLDLCSRAAPLKAGLSKLTAVLASACGEGALCVADAAVKATLSARCAGFHETALHAAAIEGDAATAALLLEHGAAADIKDAKGCTPLSRAIFEGRVAVVRLLLSTGRVNLEQQNHAAESPTYLAALRGHYECLELLLASSKAGQERARWNDFDYHDGYTPLHAAVISRSVKCIELLLASGFSPSVQNKYDQTALHIAASLEARAGVIAPTAVAEVLLAAGCDPQLKDERGHTAAHVAKAKGQLALLELITSHHHHHHHHHHQQGDKPPSAKFSTSSRRAAHQPPPQQESPAYQAKHARGRGGAEPAAGAHHHPQPTRAALPHRQAASGAVDEEDGTRAADDGRGGGGGKGGKGRARRRRGGRGGAGRRMVAVEAVANVDASGTGSAPSAVDVA